MIRSFSLILLVLFTLSAAAQKKDVNNAAPKKNDIVATIGDLQITKEEFEANYKKNNSNILDEKDKKTPAQYLDMYINFKLKVLEAKRLGYDTIKSFVNELKGYRAELAKPYLTNVSFTEDMVKKEYERTKYERKASHIMIRLAPDATPADTMVAWNKISALRKQVMDGADFGEVAAKSSEDPSAVKNKGELGYFSAFQMTYPFENMAYLTPVGQISNIVRTRFGYHIIKVEDERESSGQIKVAHIMKLFPKQASDETIAKLKLSADSIWQKATSGADFAELAKKYSDDKQSAPNGGVMNWFTRIKMVPEFAEAAFALKKDGDISPVIRTPYGWHIIKRLEYRPVDSFEKMRPDLEDKIKKSFELSKYSDEIFDNQLRTEYHLKTYDDSYTKLYTLLADTAHKDNLSEKVSPLKNTQLFSFADKTYTGGDFTEYLKQEHFMPKKLSLKDDLKKQYDTFIHKKLIDYEDTQLEAKHPDFASVYNEYHDGILLFNISKDKIWDVASSDTVRLEKYFDQTSKKYYWNDRFKGWILQAKDLETRNKIETLLDKKEMTKQELNDLFNTKTENNLQITDVAVEKGENPIVDYYIWSGPKPAGFDETTTFVHGKTVKNELKTLKDAWGLYSSDFQEQIEKEWIDSLRQRYPVVIHKKVLKKIPQIG